MCVYVGFRFLPFKKIIVYIYIYYVYVIYIYLFIYLLPSTVLYTCVKNKVQEHLVFSQRFVHNNQIDFSVSSLCPLIFTYMSAF